jgi:hypothetical protein
VTLYGAPLKEVTYVHMSQSLIFQHAKVQPPLMPNQVSAEPVGSWWSACGGSVCAGLDY